MDTCYLFDVIVRHVHAPIEDEGYIYSTKEKAYNGAINFLINEEHICADKLCADSIILFGTKITNDNQILLVEHIVNYVQYDEKKLQELCLKYGEGYDYYNGWYITLVEKK
jgi:hypothetical protein